MIIYWKFVYMVNWLSLSYRYLKLHAMIFYELSDAIRIETWLKKCPISESYKAMAHYISDNTDIRII